MSWARSRALRAVPLMVTLAALPATRARATDSRPALDLDHMAQRDGRWVAPLPGLRRGTLVYRVSSRDLVGNASKVLTHKQKLTR